MSQSVDEQVNITVSWAKWDYATENPPLEILGSGRVWIFPANKHLNVLISYALQLSGNRTGQDMTDRHSLLYI